ncbi:TPA: HlyD family type I secretion periplasmic adaptor subunit [Citrobacter sedlakii]
MNGFEKAGSGLRWLRRHFFGMGQSVIWLCVLLLGLFWLWACMFRLDEVTTGTGKIIPSAREQLIQSLEGGLLTEMKVQEGDIVLAGQVLARLDPTIAGAGVDEAQGKLRAALAMLARLHAEVDGTPLTFPPELKGFPQLLEDETSLYHSRQNNLKASLSGLQDGLALVNKELRLTASLVAKGAASDVEVLRLRRQANYLQSKIDDTRNQYIVKAREELAKAAAEVEEQKSVIRGRADSLKRTTLYAPVKGIVKNIEVNTIGGVVQPRGNVMEIVPIDDRLLVEVEISPRDVAFITPGQRAKVKLTAYDYHIYGGLEGKVVFISPDTIQDEVHRDRYYYRVYVRTEKDYLTNQLGKHFPLYPGMIATADIHTGSKTIMEYLIKPLNRAREALRER